MNNEKDNSQKVNKVVHYYTEDQIKKNYKFWDTQLVPKFHEKNPIELGPIKSHFDSSDIQPDPYILPEGMEWKEIDISNSDHLDTLYNFLIQNYHEVSQYKEQYSKEFLQWQFTPIKNAKYRNILLSIQKDNEMIGFFSALPMRLHVYGNEIIAYNISFLCIAEKYRNKNLPDIYFREMFRRNRIEKIYQNVFISKRLIPKPFAESIYYYIYIDDKNFGKYEVSKDKLAQFRIMEKKDVNLVHKLISEDNKKYKIYTTFSEDEIEHWLIPRKNVIYSYVKENDCGDITDFISYYMDNSFIYGEYQKWGYLYLNIATTMSSKELMMITLNLAKKDNLNCITCGSIRDNEICCKELNFVYEYENKDSYGALKYYFINYICPETNANDISLILI